MPRERWQRVKRVIKSPLERESRDDVGSFAEARTLVTGEHCAISIAFRSPKSPRPTSSYDATLLVTSAASGQPLTARLIGTTLQCHGFFYPKKGGRSKRHTDRPNPERSEKSV